MSLDFVYLIHEAIKKNFIAVKVHAFLKKLSFLEGQRNCSFCKTRSRPGREKHASRRGHQRKSNDQKLLV